MWDKNIVAVINGYYFTITIHILTVCSLCKILELQLSKFVLLQLKYHFLRYVTGSGGWGYQISYGAL